MNDKINVLLILTVISLFISLFLAFFLLTVKTKHQTSNSLFAFFLILTAIDSSSPLLELITSSPSNLGIFRTTLAFLQLPVFYLYVVSVCYSDFRLKPKYILHLLPFLVANVILLPRFYAADAVAKMNFIVNRKSMIEIPFNHILIHIQIVVYFIAVFILLKRAKKLYLENFAGANINSYNWLFQFTVVLSILYFITLFKNIFKFSDYSDIYQWTKIGIIVFQLFISCWYLFKALNHPSLFRNIDSNLKLVSDIVLEEKTSSIVAVTDKEYNEELMKLKRYMAEEKPFLNPSLTIQDVSAAIEIPVRHLSLLINHKLEQHFYDFVNMDMQTKSRE